MMLAFLFDVLERNDGLVVPPGISLTIFLLPMSCRSLFIVLVVVLFLMSRKVLSCRCHAVRLRFLLPYRAIRYHLREYSVRSPQNARELFDMRHSLQATVEWPSENFSVLLPLSQIIRRLTFLSLSLIGRLIQKKLCKHSQI
jgi:hypothetical protein